MDNVWVGHPYFSGFCRFGYFSMNFFLLCGVLRVGAGQLVMRGCCWGGVSKKLFQGSLTWQIPSEYSDS